MYPWADHLAAGSSFDPVSPVTLLDIWQRQWRRAPSAPLFIAEGVVTTAGAFADVTARLARRLLGRGLQAGDRVVWSCDSSLDALVANVAILRAGLVVVPVNPAYSEREVRHVVSDVRPAAAIVSSPVMAEWLRGAMAGPVVPPSVPLPDGDDLPLDGAMPDDAALIGFTSGTTGAPKGAVLTHANLRSGIEALCLAWRWTPDDRLIHTLPVFHAHGLCVGIYGTLTAGASAELHSKFSADLVAERARSGAATLFFGVPTMFHRIAHEGRAPALSRLRMCVSGSAPLSAELHRSIASASGQAVLERFGMTETLMNTSNPAEGERRAGTVGFPLPGVEVRLVEGEIQVRGGNVCSGYWERPSATAESFVGEDSHGPKWFRTGDLGEIVDGYLVIRGRAKELIITGGYNVYPAEVEDVLARCPGVADVAVTGTPSEEWGEVVTAWVVPDGTAPTPEEIASWAAASLAPYKVPRQLHVVSALPRNAMGKLVRSALRP